jgi:hypothetical protein
MNSPRELKPRVDRVVHQRQMGFGPIRKDSPSAGAVVKGPSRLSATDEHADCESDGGREIDLLLDAQQNGQLPKEQLARFMRGEALGCHQQRLLCMRVMGG